MIIFGIRLFGRAEIVPGIFFIATQFFHICFIPLIPMHSLVVIEDPQMKGQGVALPKLHWGSVSMAWLRQLLLVGGVVLLFLAWNKLDAQAQVSQVRPMLLMAFGCFAGFAGSYRVARATPASLAALAGVEGVPAKLLARAREQLGAR